MSITLNGTTGITTPAIDNQGNLTVDGGTIKLDGNYPVGTNNVALGDAAGDALTTGGNLNTFVGSNAGSAVTTGGGNTAIGAYAFDVGTGSYNTGLGSGSLGGSSNTASSNTGIGYDALNSTTTGYNNTAIGANAARNNTTAAYNIAMGYEALFDNTTGQFNTALGSLSLANNTTASNNTAVGCLAAYSNTTGTYNAFLGLEAGKANTTGSYNTVLGYKAGTTATTSNFNTYLGTFAGELGSGEKNTFVGQNAGVYVSSGAKNTILGRYDGNQGGLDIRTSSNYIVLSNGDGDPRLYLNNDTAFVLQGTANAANPYITSYDSSLYVYGRRISSSGVYLAHNATSWASTSDENRKDIIEPITDAVNKVLQLRTVIGKYKIDEEGTRRPFLIAQDVQAVLPEAVQSQEDNAGEFLGMSYTDIIPLLTAAIKEQQATITALTARITALEGN